MTDNVQETIIAVKSDSPDTNVADVSKSKDGRKDKHRALTKVVIRRLPPSITEEQFLEQISPLPDNDYFYFVKADMSLGQYAFSRAYINFINQEDIFIFREKFDNYVFVDAKGTEYPAVVEFAPFQRLPKKRIGKKKDPKCGTIESDPYYISFLDNLKNSETKSNNSQPKTEYSYQLVDNIPKKITTPLLEYIKQRKQEKQRIRDEKREERRRRDLERRRTKEEPSVSKVLKNPESGKEPVRIMRDTKENRDDKEKISLKELKFRNKKEEKFRERVSRDRDGKPYAKSYREKEEKSRDKDILKYQKKYEDRKSHLKKDDRDNIRDKIEGRKSDFRGEQEFKDRKTEEKRGKSYEKMRQEKRRLTETRRQIPGEIPTTGNTVKSKEDRVERSGEKKDEEASVLLRDREKTEIEKNAIVAERKAVNEISYVESPVKHSKIEDDEISNSEVIEIISKRVDEMSLTSDKSKSNEHLDRDSLHDGSVGSKLVKRRSSLGSGGESGGGDGSVCLRRHKSLDGDDHNLQTHENSEKDKNKKDPRLERRIRNKDRPAMEIYRPGMSRFSKQRLEREKSTTDDGSSPSQSPAPGSGVSTVSKSNKNSSEVRSMTFKRSSSRDIPY